MKNNPSEQDSPTASNHPKDSGIERPQRDSEDFETMWKEQVIQKLKLLSQNEDLGDVLIKAHAVMKHYQQKIKELTEQCDWWKSRFEDARKDISNKQPF